MVPPGSCDQVDHLKQIVKCLIAPSSPIRLFFSLYPRDILTAVASLDSRTCFGTIYAPCWTSVALFKSFTGFSIVVFRLSTDQHVPFSHRIVHWQALFLFPCPGGISSPLELSSKSCSKREKKLFCFYLCSLLIIFPPCFSSRRRSQRICILLMSLV